MDGGSVFERQLVGGVIAVLCKFAVQGVASGVEERLHASDFGVVVGVGAAFEAGGEAHLHFGIDAAGESGVGMEVINAPAHLEKVEGVAGKLFGGGARGERAVVEISSGETGVSPVLGPQARWVSVGSESSFARLDGRD